MENVSEMLLKKYGRAIPEKSSVHCEDTEIMTTVYSATTSQRTGGQKKKKIVQTGGQRPELVEQHVGLWETFEGVKCICVCVAYNCMTKSTLNT